MASFSRACVWRLKWLIFVVFFFFSLGIAFHAKNDRILRSAIVAVQLSFEFLWGLRSIIGWQGFTTMLHEMTKFKWTRGVCLRLIMSSCHRWRTKSLIISRHNILKKLLNKKEVRIKEGAKTRWRSTEILYKTIYNHRWGSVGLWFQL